MPPNMVNNYDWTRTCRSSTSCEMLVRTFPLNTMLDRDTVSVAWTTTVFRTPSSPTCCSSPNDFVQLHRNFDCVLQVGGGDQWGNLVSGVDLNRRMDGATPFMPCTVPLVTDSEGQEVRQIDGWWLAVARSGENQPAYSWYQYFINAGDSVVIVTCGGLLSSPGRIDELEVAVAERPFNARRQHASLAK